MDTNRFADAWAGFKGRLWKEEVNTRDFIQNNYKPYDGDESFLAEPTEATNKLWGRLQERLKSGMSFEDRKRSIKASTERTIDSMGTLKKSALARAQGFRNPKIEKRYLEEFSESLKNKLSRKNKK